MAQLSPQQIEAFDGVMAWHKTKEKRFVLAGYAGAGKTTLAKQIADEIGHNGTIFCAYTGKAANVLREKECMNAGTIHSYLYSLTDHDREAMKILNEEMHRMLKMGDTATANRISEQVAEMRANYRKPKYDLNMQSKLADAKLVIVDEYSMLSEELIKHIELVAKKVLYIGDPFQLPPVKGECSLQPDYFITEIHRQALDSPIIRYSKMVREGETISFCSEGEFEYGPQQNFGAEIYSDADQVIVGMNKTRMEWNKRFRDLAGHEGLPRAGEKMICLKNSPVNGLFNGMIGYAASDARPKRSEHYILDFDDNAGLNVYAGDINGTGDKYDGYNPYHRTLDRFDFGYAITAHKSQGSEFDKVVIYNQPIGRGVEAQRWLYTSLTRAKKKCILVQPR